MKMRANRNYNAMKCKECGTLNIIHENQITEKIYCNQGCVYAETNAVCADCEGKLEYIGKVILQDESESLISVSVDVEREPFDRLLEDIAKLTQEVSGIDEKIKDIRRAAGSNGMGIQGVTKGD